MVPVLVKAGFASRGRGIKLKNLGTFKCCSLGDERCRHLIGFFAFRENLQGQGGQHVKLSSFFSWWSVKQEVWQLWSACVMIAPWLLQKSSTKYFFTPSQLCNVENHTEKGTKEIIFCIWRSSHTYRSTKQLIDYFWKVNFSRNKCSREKASKVCNFSKVFKCSSIMNVNCWVKSAPHFFNMYSQVKRALLLSHFAFSENLRSRCCSPSIFLGAIVFWHFLPRFLQVVVVYVSSARLLHGFFMRNSNTDTRHRPGLQN